MVFSYKDTGMEVGRMMLKEGMRYIISVHPKRVADKEPNCIRLQYGPDAPENYVKKIVLKGPAVIVTNHDSPLPCGARVWIETEGEVEIEV